jgi:hypothetical protein
MGSVINPSQQVSIYPSFIRAHSSRLDEFTNWPSSAQCARHTAHDDFTALSPSFYEALFLC